MSRTLVLAIDPGSLKCGVALVSGGSGSGAATVVEKAVIDRKGLADTLRRLSQSHPETIVLGNGTRRDDVLREIQSVTNCAVQVVDERETTLAARKLYFEDHPPSGWRRLLPLSMQVPPEAYDDYVAVLLAKRYLEAKSPLRAGGD